jgi:hypothetical protein
MLLIKNKIKSICMKRFFFFAIAAVVFFSSCTKETDSTPSVVSGTKTIAVNFSSASQFTFFRFSDSSVVVNTDSATNKWDFGLRFTTFIVNSNSSGPGAAGAILLDGTFDGVTTAPTTGYAYDTTTTRRAIKDGSWYNYNGATRTFTPKAGKLFVFKTANGTNYAKMELLSADYAPFTGMFPTTILYKFRYTYQANGSTTF